jgi:hypothetical protein
MFKKGLACPSPAPRYRAVGAAVVRMQGSFLIALWFIEAMKLARS